MYVVYHGVNHMHAVCWSNLDKIVFIHMYIQLQNSILYYSNYSIRLIFLIIQYTITINCMTIQ